MLKKVNEKLTPADVKSKSRRLLPYTKSVEDYSVLLTEVQLAKLAYHTYPVPGAVQPRLFLKGIPPNVPAEETQANIKSQEPRVVKTVHVTKMDNTAHTVIAKFPGFVVTFQHGTDVRDVLKIKKVCHCIIQLENTKTPSPSANVLTATLLAIHLSSVANPPGASNATNRIKLRRARNPLARLQTCQLWRSSSSQFH
jgi:hypothetical protein